MTNTSDQENIAVTAEWRDERRDYYTQRLILVFKIIQTKTEMNTK